MSNQAQIDALEHLLIALLNSGITTDIPKSHLLEKAQASILGDNGPGGPEQKSDALDYLNFIGSRIR